MCHVTYITRILPQPHKLWHVILHMSFTQGSPFPANVQFKHVPVDLSNLDVLNPLVCQLPQVLNLDDIVTKGTTVIVAVPGAFTPTCTEQHAPAYLSKLAELKQARVDTLIIYTGNDAFVVNAWGKLLLQAAHLDNNGDYPKVVFASDPDAAFSTANGLLKAPGRPVRFVSVVKDGKVEHFAAETELGVNVSGVDDVLKVLV